MRLVLPDAVDTVGLEWERDGVPLDVAGGRVRLPSQVELGTREVRAEGLVGRRVSGRSTSAGIAVLPGPQPAFGTRAAAESRSRNASSSGAVPSVAVA